MNLQGELKEAAAVGIQILDVFSMKGLADQYAYEVCFGLLQVTDFYKKVIELARKQVETYHSFIEASCVKN